VAALEAVVLQSISPWDLLGLELYFLDTVAARRTPPQLVIYSLAGRLVSIGRYHLFGGPPEREGTGAMRRLTGGRAVGGGDGWVGLALIAPSWSAMLPERDANLKPDQVMNRYARGVLAALRSLGLECFYPGRDAITIDRREVAMCSFESDASGALLFEVSLAADRGMEELSRDLDRLDAEGSVPSAVHGPDSSTTLRRELHRESAFSEIARALIAGFSQMFGNVRERELAAGQKLEGAHRGRELQSIHWLNRATSGSHYNRMGRVAGQLGQIEARLRISGDNRIERLLLSGDFIANSRAIGALEAALEGQPHDLPAVSRAVTKVFSANGNFILGAGELSNLVRLIANAQ